MSTIISVEKFINRRDAVNLKNEMQEKIDCLDNAKPIGDDLDYWSTIFLAAYKKLLGFAAWLTLKSHDSIRCDLVNQRDLYNSVIDMYDSGFTGVKVTTRKQFLSTIMNGNTEEGWVPYGSPSITAVRTSDGLWRVV
ncbi:MAG: hypothetical protein JJT76_11425 [Clostridiaceae bacterium]|nr:hypothetical protein [Clostridiaceae bacterium]